MWPAMAETLAALLFDNKERSRLNMDCGRTGCLWQSTQLTFRDASENRCTDRQNRFVEHQARIVQWKLSAMPQPAIGPWHVAQHVRKILRPAAETLVGGDLVFTD